MIHVDQLAAGWEGEWDDFLRRRPDGVFGHSIAYRNLLVSALDCEPEYLVAREGDQVRGVLPVMWSVGEGGRICNSLPYYGSPGGPVSADPRAARALIDAWDERASDPGTLAATMIENPFAEEIGREPLHELTDERISQFTVLPRGGGEEEVSALISPEARFNLRRAARRGVIIEHDNDALPEVRRIHEEVMETHSTPAKSRRFFEAIPTELRAGEDFDIWIARVAGEVAAAMLVIRFNGVSEYFTSGTRAGFRSHDPHAALVFTALVHETRNGARIWNWGGTRLGMAGVFHFKRKWGSRERRYRYFVRLNDQSLRESPAETLLARFPNFYVLPFSALTPAVF